MSQRCFDTWKKHLGNYQFQLWEKANRPRGVPWLERMLRLRQWAFASDYIRLHALYTQGGVYLDLDVEVCRSFDPLLSNRAFLGYEDPTRPLLACHVIGAEPGHPFVKQCMEFYRRSWRLRWSFPPTMPQIVTGVARKAFGYLRYLPEGQVLRDGVAVYPVCSFTPVSYTERRLSSLERYQAVRADTYALHHWSHGWSWLHLELREAVPRIPWLFMGLSDWRFVLRGLMRERRRRARESRLGQDGSGEP